MSVGAQQSPAVSDWELAKESLRQPYPVPLTMVLLLALVPFYIFIASWLQTRVMHIPAVAWDYRLPLVPGWAIIYGALYSFLILLPILAVRQADLVRRMFAAYLFVWVVAFVSFWLYPTAAPRPAHVSHTGFAAWGLLRLYDFDPPYNCFPSLHVAHSFVSAFAVYRVRRGVGIFSGFVACLVAISTLLTKQHYLADVIAGALLAAFAYWLFLWSHPRFSIEQGDFRVAPFFARAVLGVSALEVLGAWVFYLFRR